MAKKKKVEVKELSDKEKVQAKHPEAACVKLEELFCIVSEKSEDKYEFRISPFKKSDEDAWKMAAHRL